jgi:cytoskeletal protein CcmA (bactofilin family)/ribosomal protein S27E
MKPEKINVACPHCGHVQLEPRDGYSTVCKQCQRHFRLEDVLHPKTGPADKPHNTRQVTCFQCATVLDVSTQAESTMCKRCSTHIDLRNYTINQAVSKNFRTHGSFEVGDKGYVFNTEVEAGDAVIRGRFLGKIHAHRTLTIYAPEQFKGSFKAGLLIIPEGVKLLWPKPLEVQSAYIAGELVASVRIPGTVELKATGLLFGDVEAANLLVEDGGVLVGHVKIGSRTTGITTPPASEAQQPTPETSAKPETSEPGELPGLTVEPPKPARRKSSAKSKTQN